MSIIFTESVDDVLEIKLHELGVTTPDCIKYWWPLCKNLDLKDSHLD